MADLGVMPDKINVVTYPRDGSLPPESESFAHDSSRGMLRSYVGSFAPQKNSQRLIDPFGQTEFARNGGRLHWSVRRPPVRTRCAPVDTGPSSRARLPEPPSRSYAMFRLLVVPSLEEGFGLPAWEAILLRPPVAASNGGSLPRRPMGCRTFWPTNEAELAAAVDRAAEADPPSSGRPIALPSSQPVRHGCKVRGPYLAWLETTTAVVIDYETSDYTLRACRR